MKIRKVIEDDYTDILKLQLQLEDVEIGFDNNLRSHCYETEKGKQKLKTRINNQNNIFYVAINDDNESIGFIDGNIPDDEWWYKDKVAYINHLCVEEKHRRLGVATKLLYCFEKTAKENGAKYIRLLAFSKNKPAITFYKNNNFMEYSTYYNKTIL